MVVDVQTIGLWVNVSLVFITLLAVIVAIFGKTFWDWHNKPKIRLALSNNEPYVITYYNTSLMPKLFRLKVINLGNTVLKNCKVKIISVLPTQVTFEPDVLKWSNSPRDMQFRIDTAKDIQFSDIQNLSPIYREFKDISPNGGWEFCDLFLHGTGGDTIKFSSLGSREFVTHQDSYLVRIEISGDNLKPEIASFRISNLHRKRYLKIDWEREN